MNFIYPIICYLFLMLTNKIYAGVMHSHTNEVNKERETDGAYSPRDHSHYSDEGDHYTEFDHEAILGSHKEAEEFDHLSPEESKRRLAILLKKMDLDDDNQIGRNELKAWIIRSFKMLSEEEAKDRMEDADENNDGIVTWQEYLADTYGIDSSENTIDIGSENEHLIQDDKNMWKAADINNDGVLDANEWVSFSHPEEHPNMLPIILEQTLKDKDKDEDGAINFQEYIGTRGNDISKDDLIAEKAKFDDLLDKNKDGKLEGNEILSWIVPSNDEIAQEEVDHLFAHSDDNHDDILSFEEILDHHDTFVGSEATDYGDHLHNIHHFDDEL
ncbi:reticulocalbin-2 isoform X1 [Diorhabda carinulata]|uniref:reticulocalbin-2 isoform X1 n=1 Tax=Diorhabda carinulata TaxID=1163345 RepID=UPI0025A081E2|nr:reticulocalbin-2 isoform X1 [Diorhabda carinulata]